MSQVRYFENCIQFYQGYQIMNTMGTQDLLDLFTH